MDLEIYYRVHKGPPLVHIPSQMYPIHFQPISLSSILVLHLFVVGLSILQDTIN
jgi:hypothetical protein